ncbi:alanine:cation symporter family protein [Streptoalloteichus hindustanus]|uniref:Uncharacterized protein n=1 Tax=Streptoalloteichus hindustanus TaxID=2017 RepID=A0A1M4VNJ7_STRHI|nr:alanine:cation symporter family protein [Streptoalloteichus hindustanus]SHE70455.1 hypothetical protein SAMN05444320_101830 [Streptoalloteichus hindustanus]
MRVRAQLLTAAVAALTGVGLVLSPVGDDTRLLELAPGHGPSAGDLLGLALVVVGVVWLEALVLRYLPAVRRRLGDRPLFAIALLGGFGFGIAVVSAVQGGPWWTTGLLLASLSSVVLGGVLASVTPG